MSGMIWGMLLLGLGCGRRAPPAPVIETTAPITATLGKATVTEDGMRAIVMLDATQDVVIERAEFGLWLGGSAPASVGTHPARSRLAAGQSVGFSVYFRDVTVEVGQAVRLTGSVYGDYGMNQKEVVTVEMTGEVVP
ncbi:MAG: hypothetical protein AAFV53_22900 [Myxococcota bacterium]